MTVTKTIFMPRKIHEAWDAALRSNKYKQAKNTLIDECTGAMCCLGVLQKVVSDTVEDRTAPSQPWLDSNGIKFLFSYDEIDSTDSLESGVIPIVTNIHAYPLSMGKDPDYSLIKVSELNDKGYSFRQIADLIAERVEYTD